MRVAIIGANGQLGTDLVAECAARGHEVAPLTHADLNVEDAASVVAVLARHRPDVVVNTAAYHVTADCEKHPDRAFAVNATGALHVARAAADLGAAVVYVSTDYVFDGAKGAPYVEGDLPAPVNVYGASKVAGEHLTLANSDQAMVIRVSGLYGAVPCRAKGENFITKMIRAAQQQPQVRVVTDEILTPTPTSAVAKGALDLVAADGRGTFHLTCEGACSWFDFARTIFDEKGIAAPLQPASVRDFPAGVRRPHYSVLENTRLRALGVAPMPDWRDALVQFLRSQ